MSDLIPPNTPPPVPSAAGPVAAATENYEPITGVISAVEAILRDPARLIYQLRQQGQGRLIAAMLVVATFCALIYGVVVGTFSGDQQLWAAPVKIAAGLLLSGFICLPSLYIFSCLSGSPARLLEVCGFLAGLLALSTILLIGFAPVAWVFSESAQSLAGMGALHLVFWVVATWFGL